MAAPETSPDVSVHTGWQFVNLSQSNQSRDVDTRKLVRVNAMRDYRRRQQKQRQGAATDRSLHSATIGKKPLAPQPPADTLDLQPLTFTKDSLLQENFGDWPGQSENALNEFQAMWAASRRTSASAKRANGSYEDGLASSTPRRPRKRISVNVSPVSVLGGGSTDPFNIYPISGYSRHSELLDHCKYPHLISRWLLTISF